MSAVDWTKISNKLADSSDWEYIASKIKIELKLDIDPAVSMFVWEEYLKMAHKKNNPCVKNAEFESRTYNTRNLFLSTRNLDYITFDKLIKFINKQFIEVGKLDKYYKIVKFNDYYQEKEKVVNDKNLVNNSVNLVNKSVNGAVNNLVNLEVNKKISSLRSYICRIKKGKQTSKHKTLEQLENELNELISQRNLVNSQSLVNRSVNLVNDKSIVSQSLVNGGERGGDISQDSKENRIKNKEVSKLVSDEVNNKSTSKVNIDQPTNHQLFNFEILNNFKKSVMQNCISADKNRGYYSVNMCYKVDILKEFQIDYEAKIPICKIHKEELKKYPDAFCDFLKTHTQKPFNFTDEEYNKMREDFRYTVFNSQVCTLYSLFLFIQKFKHKKPNGYWLDHPTCEDLIEFCEKQKEYCLRCAESDCKIVQKNIDFIELYQANKDKPKIKDLCEIYPNKNSCFKIGDKNPPTPP